MWSPMTKYSPMMTITQFDIRLEGLRFYAYHGVLPQERKVGGRYTVDLVLTLPAPVADAATVAAIAADDLAGTVNYAEVYAVVRREMETPSYLLEHVAGRILHAVFDAFPLVEKASVTLRKDTPPMGAACNGCAVTLTAQR